MKKKFDILEADIKIVIAYVLLLIAFLLAFLALKK